MRFLVSFAEPIVKFNLDAVQCISLQPWKEHSVTCKNSPWVVLEDSTPPSFGKNEGAKAMEIFHCFFNSQLLCFVDVSIFIATQKRFFIFIRMHCIVAVAAFLLVLFCFCNVICGVRLLKLFDGLGNFTHLHGTNCSSQHVWQTSEELMNMVTSSFSFSG